MMKHGVQKLISLMMTLCLMMGLFGAAQAADFDALSPLMDLVSAASFYSANAPESVPGEDGMLTVSFTDAFFKIGQTHGTQLGVNSTMLTDLNAQADFLRRVFAAQIPALEPVLMTDDIGSYIGFQPVTVNNGTDGNRPAGRPHMKNTAALIIHIHKYKRNKGFLLKNLHELIYFIRIRTHLSGNFLRFHAVT